MCLSCPFGRPVTWSSSRETSSKPIYCGWPMRSRAHCLGGSPTHSVMSIVPGTDESSLEAHIEHTRGRARIRQGLGIVAVAVLSGAAQPLTDARTATRMLDMRFERALVGAG